MSRFSAGHAEVVEDDALVVGVLEGVEAVLAELEVFVFLVGQIDDEHGGAIFDQANQADRAAGDDVGDEQLLAVDDVFVAVTLGTGLQGGEVGAGAGFGQGEGGQTLAAGELGQEPLFLFGGAEGAHRVDGADAAVDARRGRRPWDRASPSWSETWRRRRTERAAPPYS